MENISVQYDIFWKLVALFANSDYCILELVTSFGGIQTAKGTVSYLVFLQYSLMLTGVKRFLLGDGLAKSWIQTSFS